MDLLLFGLPGAVVKTGRLERLAFNAAFEELDLGIYWNVATYCKLAELPSGAIYWGRGQSNHPTVLAHLRHQR